MQDGMTWLLITPEESLAYILADSGFDVWVANNRGTRWSSRHVSLDPSSRDYWDWSWDDLVVNDMPTLVDYVSSHTRQKPHFLGHSMVNKLPRAFSLPASHSTITAAYHGGLCFFLNVWMYV